MGDLEKTAKHSKTAEKETGTTTAASEGPRSTENSSDVKKAVPSSVDSQESAALSTPGAGENTASFDLGTEVTSAGEGAPTVKSTKDDPGTAHPAKAGGEKYASIDAMIEGANDLTARMVVFAKQAAGQNTSVTTSTVGKPKKDEKPAKVVPVAEKAAATSIQEKAALFDKLAGYIAGQEMSDEILAQIMSHAPVQTQQATQKQAEADKAEAGELIKWAHAESTRLYKQADAQTTDLVNFLKDFSKKSMDDLAALTGGGAAAPQADPLAALLAGAGGGAGGDPAAEMLGGAGGDPAAAMLGGAGGEAAPGQGGEIDPALLEALLVALQEQGLTGEQLGGGEGGGEASPAEVLGEEAAPAKDPASAAAGLAENGSAVGGESEGEEEPSEAEEKEAQAQLSKLAEALLPHLTKSMAKAKAK